MKITDSGMWYRIGGMTIGTIDLRLGEDTFAKAGKLHDGEHLWVGNNRSGYYRHYHFGGAGGGHQHFWLSFNDSDLRSRLQAGGEGCRV